jgi:hypothetical protein
MTEIRTDAIERLASILRRRNLTGDEKVDLLVTEPDVTDAELSYFTRQYMAAPAVQNLGETGVLAPASVLDMPVSLLTVFAAVHEIAARWDVTLDASKTLGAVLKVIPTRDASLICELLRRVGLLPPEVEIL